VIFLGLQAYEWTHLIQSGLKVFGNPWGATLFGASFYIITGFHGLHVTGGVIYLTVVLLAVSRIPDMHYNYVIAEVAGLYWHFVDLVWIMVFTFIYLL
jgi:cytochrome c oxidase subunit 3